MKIRILIQISFLSIAFLSCQQKTNEKEENLLRQQDETQQAIDNNKADLNKLVGKHKTLDSTIFENAYMIGVLQNKKDSLMDLMSKLEETARTINDSSLTISINDITQKLNELRSQKEKTLADIDLMKKKLELSKQKTALLVTEKTVYEERKKALWDKGAQPDEFTEVNYSLKKTEEEISAQEINEKLMSREIVDMEELIKSIDKHQLELSSGIRDKYSAQEIFKEYIENQKRINSEQIAAIDNQIKPYLLEKGRLNKKFEGIESEIESKKSEQNQLTKTVNEISDKQQQSEQMKVDRSKKNKQGIALAVVIVIVLLLVYLYYMGKRKKTINKN